MTIDTTKLRELAMNAMDSAKRGIFFNVANPATVLQLLDEIDRLRTIEAAPPPPKLSDERILEICGFRPESASEIGSDIVRKRWLEIARAIEREILGGEA